MTNTKRPVVKLVGQDGNAFMVLGLCNRAMKAAGWDDTKRKAVFAELSGAGSYSKLLATACEYFEVK